MVEALVESPLYERVNCRVRLLVDSGPSSWDGQVKKFALAVGKTLKSKFFSGFDGHPDIKKR